MASTKKAPEKGSRRIQSVRVLTCIDVAYQPHILYMTLKTKSTSVLFVAVQLNYNV